MFGTTSIYKEDIDYVLKRMGIDPEQHKVNYEAIASQTMNEFFEGWQYTMASVLSESLDKYVQPLTVDSTTDPHTAP